MSRRKIYEFASGFITEWALSLFPSGLAAEMRTEIDPWNQNASELVVFFLPALGVVMLRNLRGKAYPRNLRK